MGRTSPTQRLDQDDVLARSPVSCLTTDCKSLFDVVNRSQPSGLWASRKRTAIEALATRQTIGVTNIQVTGVNSDRQLADILTRRGVLPENLDRALKTNNWRIAFGSSFTPAKQVAQIGGA